MEDEKIEFIFNSFPEFIEAVKKALKEYDEAEDGEPRKIACRKAYLMNRAGYIVEEMIAGYCKNSIDLNSNENIIDLSGAGVAFNKTTSELSEIKKWNETMEDFSKNKEILFSEYDSAGSKYYFCIFKDKNEN